MTHFYGPNGEYRGYTSDVSPQNLENARQLVPVAIIVGAFYFAWTAISSWHHYSAPFRHIAHYYYVLVDWTILKFPAIWGWATDPGITHFAKINIAIALAACGGYGIGLILLVACFWYGSTLTRQLTALAMFGPAAFAAIWAAVAWVFS